ncbi:MAG: FAD-binding protein [Promethearchaeota archaeon]
MTKKVGRHVLPVYSCNTLVVGTGAAGLNAAIHLKELGVRDVVVVTEGTTMGTSRNAGSDKQTYYKTNVYGAELDSPVEHARALFGGGAMHGDVALVEATNSVREFYHLVGLGVPFPCDEYGGYVGYKTDHDPRQRATSAGPLTSRFMVEALSRRLAELGVEVLDKVYVARLFCRGEPESGSSAPKKEVVGALGISVTRERPGDPDNPWGLSLFNARNVVLATGGPASLFGTSVYPLQQHGSTGLALREGAVAQNLSEWQFGIASLKFRWNLSGSYQQSIPTYFSTDSQGNDPRQFLVDLFPEPAELAGATFMKGYQWPFDVRKLDPVDPNSCSSLIDLMVTVERRVRNRRVWVDFRENFEGFSIDRVGDAAAGYLGASDALLAKSPLARLRALNPEAIAVYLAHGIDLGKEPLEVAVCAQHCNGGLVGDTWWESNVKHLFPIGEVNGSHGIYRPGGAALNSGQVGGLRAATRISKVYDDPPGDPDEFVELVSLQVGDLVSQFESWAGGLGAGTELPASDAGDDALVTVSLSEAWRELRERSDSVLGHVRPVSALRAALKSASWQLGRLAGSEVVEMPGKVVDVLRLQDALLTQVAVLESVIEHVEGGGDSRGAALLLDPAGKRPCDSLPPDWKFRTGDNTSREEVVEVWLDFTGTMKRRRVKVRPVPECDAWFETLWRSTRGEGKSKELY